MYSPFDRLVFVDIETTGISHLTEVILEVGILITDLHLETIDYFDQLVWESPLYDNKWNALDPEGWVVKTHTKSRLYDDCRARGLTMQEAEENIAHFLQGHGISKEDPMCGSSVGFDRTHLTEQMPSVADIFSYRNIDISTLKEVCRRFNPDLYAKLDQQTQKREIHRVEQDLEDTVGEFRFYLDNFLFL